MASTVPEVAARRTPRPQRPELGQEHRQLILGYTAELIHATLHGRTVSFADPTLGGLGEQVISGSFVCLKRGKHLRSCCGILGQQVGLARALQEAADRTAWEDVRFPPVSPTELEHLEVEVWILYNPQPVHEQGEERVAAVTVGRHGVKVVRGDAHGLLLPGVAVDHNWDARRFLDQVCVKAGLHPSSWKDAETALFTFEGDPIRGRR